MKKIIYIIAVTLLISACQEVALKPSTSSTGKPAQVTEVKVTPTPGGAVISYTIPKQEDFLMVKAEYTLTNGTKRVSESSFYNSSFEMAGYFDTNEHEVKLYTVNRGMEESDPITVKFTPITDPVHQVVDAGVVFDTDICAVNIKWKNPTNSVLTYEVLVSNDNGDMVTRQITASSVSDGTYRFDDETCKERKYALLVSDNYNNVCDTIYPANKTVKPIYAVKLDGSKMKMLCFRGDNDESGNDFWGKWGGIGYTGIFDGNRSTCGHNYPTDAPTFSIDLGVKAKIKRMIFWNSLIIDTDEDIRSYYYAGNLKSYDLYSLCDSSTDDGQLPGGVGWKESRYMDIEDWNFLVSYTQNKPSGLVTPNMTEEDEIYADNGFVTDIPAPENDIVSRYIRFYINSTWGGRDLNITDIVFYGEPVE